MNRGGGHVGALRSFLKKVAQFVVVLMTTLLGLAAVTFFIGRVVPIDPVLAIVGDRASPQVYARVRQELGLDLPLLQQFWIYTWKALTGDFGTSVLTTNPVMTDIARAFPATLELATLGTIIGTVLGVFILRVMRNGIVLVGVPGLAYNIFIGAIILGMMALHSWLDRRQQAGA